MPESLKDAIVNALKENDIDVPEFTAGLVMAVIELWRYQNEAKTASLGPIDGR